MSASGFMELLERRMKRARKMIDRVDDPVAYKAMDALFGVFDAMLADATPQVVVMEMPEGKKKPDLAKPETTGEKIAHGQKGHAYL